MSGSIKAGEWKVNNKTEYFIVSKWCVESPSITNIHVVRPERGAVIYWAGSVTIHIICMYNYVGCLYHGYISITSLIKNFGKTPWSELWYEDLP